MKNFFMTKNNLRLGANYNRAEKCVEFRVFSANATDITLSIFQKPEGESEVASFDMKKGEGDIWEISVKLCDCKYLKKTFYYGFRVYGPNWVKEYDFMPGSGNGFKCFVDHYHNRFNPNKIAYDPYGLEISHLPSKYDKSRVNPENFMEDNSKFAPKSVFRYPKEFKMPSVLNPRAPKDEIIGEVHLKDLTQLLNIKEKGTYLGAVKIAKTLKKMGFTMIEFLPLTEFDDVDNYWGYMPLSYFALSKKYRYSDSSSPLDEFRRLVKAFHENDLKVCLDVVYNHTGEARIYDRKNDDANLMSYTLIDNQTYYKQTSDNFYTTYSGCDNDFNISSPAVQDLIIDSLEFWARQGVDAFRFDLAAALLDKEKGAGVNYDKFEGFASKIKQRLERRGVHVLDANEKENGVFLIAEPWMCFGNCCYQLGSFPSYWGEWNDVARNTIRANTILPHSTDPLGLRNLIEGAPFCFGDKLKSINYVSSHDGFTLNDLNSYDKKSEDTKDGSDVELCSSFGGDIKKQESSIKKQVALLCLSKGIPMFQVGDVVGHTKLGNNNSYNLDNYINYIDYSKIDDKKSREHRIYNFITSMIKFRCEHKVLTDSDYQNKIEYYGPNGAVVPYDNLNFWQNRGIDYFLFKTNGDDVIYCATSKANYPIEIRLPKNSEGKKWHLVLDTVVDDSVKEKGVLFEKEVFVLEPNSFMIFVEN